MSVRADATYQDARGWRMLTREAASRAMAGLETCAYVIVSSPEHAGVSETVEIYDQGRPQQDAAAQGKQLVQGAASWVDAQVAMGRVVLFEIHAFLEIKLYAVPKDEPVIKMLSQEAPVLAEPGGRRSSSPVILGLAVAAAMVAGGWLLFGRRRYAANRGGGPRTLRSPSSGRAGGGWVATDGVMIYGAGETRAAAEHAARWRLMPATGRLLNAVRVRGGRR